MWKHLSMILLLALSLSLPAAEPNKPPVFIEIVFKGKVRTLNYQDSEWPMTDQEVFDQIKKIIELEPEQPVILKCKDMSAAADVIEIYNRLKKIGVKYIFGTVPDPQNEGKIIQLNPPEADSPK